jgi:peptidoglycan/LPS O-acetylase OafA/YrhL
MRFGPWLAARLPRLPWLETLGAASLPVFCAHLMIVLLVLALFGANPQERAWWIDAALLAGCFTALYAVASVTLWLDRFQERKRSAAAAREDATRLPTSTTGSRLR